MRGQGMGSSPRRLGRSSPGNKGAEAPLPRRIDSLPLEQVPTVRPRQRSQEVAMTAVTSLLADHAAFQLDSVDRIFVAGFFTGAMRGKLP